MTFPCVKHANTKYKYSNTQINKYTNTAYDEVPEGPNLWYIFEKRIVQGYQKLYYASLFQSFTLPFLQPVHLHCIPCQVELIQISTYNFQFNPGWGEQNLLLSSLCNKSKNCISGGRPPSIN